MIKEKLEVSIRKDTKIYKIAYGDEYKGVGKG